MITAIGVCVQDGLIQNTGSLLFNSLWGPCTGISKQRQSKLIDSSGGETSYSYWAFA